MRSSVPRFLLWPRKAPDAGLIWEFFPYGGKIPWMSPRALPAPRPATFPPPYPWRGSLLGGRLEGFAPARRFRSARIPETESLLPRGGAADALLHLLVEWHLWLDRSRLLLLNQVSMLRSIVLILALMLATQALAQTAGDAAANRLFVEAVQLWSRAEGQPVEQRETTLRRVQSNLETIIERHSGSTLAVRLVIGETVGPLSVAGVDRAVRAAVVARAAADAAAAEARAAGVDVIFRDCPDCPEMVVVRAGRTRLAFGRDVTIAAPFAVGKFEVTFAEWDACVAQGGCSHRLDDSGWGRGRQPVVNVNWDDAQQYVAWLSLKTGKSYRLLSETEWEYAAQAGTGREAVVTPGAGGANCDGCGSRWVYKTAPVGSFPANAFGLHDMLGNVWEWTADCWNENYAGAPADGTVRLSGDCSHRVLRGGSFFDNPGYSRSAFRFRFTSDDRLVFFGFRVARTL